MISVATITIVIASLLVLIGLLQPAATRLRVPYTVLLAIAGVAIGALASFLLYTPLISTFDNIVSPLVHLPFSSSVFLYVFLPLLLFHAAIGIDIRELVQDTAPILVLAIIAVIVATLAIGFGLAELGGVSLVTALLLGSIVATTDPAAVVAIFRDVGAPGRLLRLVEGEALLNDAAAIVLFEILLGMLTEHLQPSLLMGAAHFIVSFGGGLILGAAGGRLFAMAVPLLRSDNMAEATLSLALPYIVYVLGEKAFGVSGVVAVVSSGLTAGVFASARLAPDNWRYLERVWDQIGFWASSLIFISATILVPKLLFGGSVHDIWLLAIVVVAALTARAVVLFGLLPLLALFRLSQRVSLAYQAAITWGGLRGAVTLALALAVTEDARVDGQVQHLVAVLATGFVLFTLIVNGLTLRPVVRLLKLDRLSPLNEALRAKVLALALGRVQESVIRAAEEYALSSSTIESVVAPYRERVAAISERPDLDALITDRDRVRIGLVALANQERQLTHRHQAQRTVSSPVIESLLRMTRDLADAARSEGRSGYNRVSRRYLSYTVRFRVAHAVQLRVGFAGLLRLQLTQRFEALLLLRLVLQQLQRFTADQLAPLLGDRVANVLSEMLALRLGAVARGLDALRLQYPAHAEALVKRFLWHLTLRLEIGQYRELREEGLIGRELYDNLAAEHYSAMERNDQQAPLDLGLRSEDMLKDISVFEHLDQRQRAELARFFRPRLALPDETIVKKGDRAAAMYFISSGAVEVNLPREKVRLGRGEFFGEMGLIMNRPRMVDIVAIGYCQLLVLDASGFQRFLQTYPSAKAVIEKSFETRSAHNDAFVS